MLLRSPPVEANIQPNINLTTSKTLEYDVLYPDALFTLTHR